MLMFFGSDGWSNSGEDGGEDWTDSGLPDEDWTDQNFPDGNYQNASEETPEPHENIPPREKFEEVPPPPPLPPEPPQRGAHPPQQPASPMPGGLPLLGGMVPQGAPPEPSEQDNLMDNIQEAELLYANLLLKTDFEDEFIQKMLEFEPNEEARNRIDEFVRRARKIDQVKQQQSPATTTLIL